MFFDGDNSNGVGGDLGHATTVAMEMEAFHGMGQTIASHRVTKAEQARQTGQSVETGTDRMWLETKFGQRVEARLEELLDRVTLLLAENRILVLALAHAMEAHKTVSGEDVAAIMEGHQGPIIDGRIYHDPVFQARLEEYHEAALHAHQHAAKVAIPLPGETRDPVPVGLAAASTGTPGPAPETGSWGPPAAPPSYPAPPTPARVPPPASSVPPTPKAKDADDPAGGKSKNGKNGNGKNGNGKNGKNGSSKS
jgi:hypothetical protein